MRLIYIFLLILLCTGCVKSQSAANNQIGIVGGNEIITRAQTAKMLALTKYSRAEIDKLERIIDFNDSDAEKWYDKYINAAYTAGLISGTDSDNFSPDEPLTINQAQMLIDKLYTSGRLQLKYDVADKDKPIPYSVWLEAYERLCQKNNYPIKASSIMIYATKAQCKELGDSFILCNGGLMCCEGTDISKFSDNTCYVLLRDNDIAAVKSVVTNSPVLQSAVVEEVKEDKVGVRINGGIRYFADSNGAVGDKIDINLNQK